MLPSVATLGEPISRRVAGGPCFDMQAARWLPGQPMLRYFRTASGAKTAVIAMAQATECQA
jgi:hypothetical protein